MEYFEIIKPDTKIDFVRWMKPAIILSAIIIIIGAAVVSWRGGFNYGIDFAGGSLVQIKFTQTPQIEDIRKNLETIGLGNSLIQTYGDQEIVIRTPDTEDTIKNLGAQIEAALGSSFSSDSFEVQRVEVVGPKVGKDLKKKALLAIFFSCLGIMIYVGFRFEFRYALGSIVGIIHDVLITMSIFCLMNKEFDLNIVAAFLTVVGYTINDTIVVFDRILENTRKNTRAPLRDMINMSINQTLNRTILTSLTVLLVLLVIFFFGGLVLHDFAFVMIVGVIAGAYSTTFIAITIVLAFEKIKPAPKRDKVYST
jgi:preprotein translocase subunit SecF